MKRSARTLPLVTSLMLAGAALLACAAPAQADVVRLKSNPSALILDGVRVSDDNEIFFLSGQLPSPVDPKKPMSEVKTIEDMGDSKAQTISALTKIKALLEGQGYKMSDVVKMTLFVAADPRTGKMDFAGVNEGFKMFFGTPENPNTVARSTFQVAALVGPLYLIEIEATAVKKKAGPTAAVDEQEAAPEAAAADGAATEKAATFHRRQRYPAELRKKSILV
ncbi:RidA family protein [Sphingobium nicotianae]|uniref:RidA family protein n=1 Tax=Sphingobium nicotianae TaxID=2782607 RepID=A0A9X1IRY7_9SPHN|nr:RidA family protein [Sphingobium nicotianae]MBT2187605.1 RidA family protein [Sphingobium nicotianae]